MNTVHAARIYRVTGRAAITALVTVLIAILTGCGEVESQPMSEVSARVYYIKKGPQLDGELLSAEPVTMGEEGDLLSELIQRVSEQPESELLQSCLPVGAEVMEYRLRDGELILELGSGYLELTGIERTLANYCLALTFCGTAEVRAVTVNCGGETLYRGLTPEDVLLSDDSGTDRKRLRLYFPEEDGFLGVEYRYYDSGDGASPERRVMEMLLAGPESETLSAGMPEGTELRSISLSTGEDGICTVNLSAEFAANFPETLAEQRLAVYGVVNSLCSISGIKKVRFLIDGRVVQSCGYIPMSEPFERNASIGTAPRSYRGEAAVTIYLQHQESGLYAPIGVSVRQQDTPEQAAVRALVNAQGEPGFVNCLTAEDMPLSLSTKSGVCEVELPPDFYEMEGAAVNAAANALIATLTAIPGINGVIFRMDGKPPGYGGGTLTGTLTVGENLLLQ